MKRIYAAYSKLSKQLKDSLYITVVIVGAISTVMSVAGVSLNQWINSVWRSLGVILISGIIILIICYCSIGKIYKNEVGLIVRKTNVCITVGDIFNTSGWKVIGCDNHFDLRVDDVIIAKKSLHGQLV